MEYEKLHPNSIKSWVIARVITTLIIGVPLLVWRFKAPFKEGDIGAIVATIFVVVIWVISLLNIVLYPTIEYKQWKYIITKDKIEFSEGIFSIKKVTIPIIRIQHIQVNQGPINRWLKLADIQIATASGNHKIPNLELEKAGEISEYLKNKIQEKVELELRGNMVGNNEENTTIKENSIIEENSTIKVSSTIELNPIIEENIAIEEENNV